MVDVPIELIKKLRDLSGAGMMDCKQALEEADGDVDKAYTILREKGIAKASKRAGRATGQGVVEAYLHSPSPDFPPQVGVLIEVNCETDFVAKGPDFRKLAKELALQVAAFEPRWVTREDVPDEVLVTEKAALDAAIARGGFPLVMKIQSRDIPHKSEVGGVRVNIATKGEAFAVYQSLQESVQRQRPEAAIQGVLVGPMAKKGIEIIVGTLLDATFGPMIMVGLGGITTELFRDVIYRPAPISAPEASAMLAELKAAPLLNGFRGAAKADIAALSQLIAQVSVLAAQLCNDVAEIEINPVLVHPVGQGVTIVDALVVRKKA